MMGRRRRRSASGQTLPSHSAAVRINVRCCPHATKSWTSRPCRNGPTSELIEPYPLVRRGSSGWGIAERIANFCRRKALSVVLLVLIGRSCNSSAQFRMANMPENIMADHLS